MNKHTGRWNEWSARWILERCVRHGVQQVVLCPGSRSTPLAVAAMDIPNLNVTVHFDERGAAFYALGLARASSRPVIWLTTSGTAVANGLPAVVEASQSRIPLVLLTADRPPELRGCGANQAIDQVNLFGTYCRYFKDICCSNPDMSQGWYETEVDHALQASRQPGRQGPVHLNLMIREPLLEEDRDADSSSRNPGQVLSADLAEMTELPGLPGDRFKVLQASMEEAKEGFLVIGKLHSDKETQAARQFARELGWPCVADVGSGIRFSEDVPTLIQHMDLLLLNDKVRWNQPDLILWVGGPVVSRRLLEWMGQESRTKLVRVSSNLVLEDPLHRASEFYVSSIVNELPRLAGTGLPAASKNWLDGWSAADRAVAAEWAQPDLSSGQGVSQAEIAQLVTEVRETDYRLFIGNSLPIREVDQFGALNNHIQHVSANRGASGIDGLIASAAGDAAASGQPTLAVLGDVSFLHDVNSLALLPGLETPFVLLVVNNDGGGIFHFLPVRKQVREFEKTFAAPHGGDLLAAAGIFGIPAEQVNSLADLRTSLREGLSSPGPRIIEVKTDRSATQAAFEELAEKIRRLSLKL